MRNANTPPSLRQSCLNCARSRIRIEPRSGGILLAPGASPGFSVTSRHQPRRGGSRNDLPPLWGLNSKTTPTPGSRPGLAECRRFAAQFGCGYAATLLSFSYLHLQPKLDSSALRRRGGCAIKKMAPFLIGADGVVVSSYRLSKPGALNKRQLELPRPLLSKDASQHFL